MIQKTSFDRGTIENVLENLYKQETGGNKLAIPKNKENPNAEDHLPVKEPESSSVEEEDEGKVNKKDKKSSTINYKMPQ